MRGYIYLELMDGGFNATNPKDIPSKAVAAVEVVRATTAHMWMCLVQQPLSYLE